MIHRFIRVKQKPPVNKMASSQLMMALAVLALVSFSQVASQEPLTKAEQNATTTTSREYRIPLASILPKLNAIHEDSKSLLAKNLELTSKIMAGMKATQNANEDHKLSIEKINEDLRSSINSTAQQTGKRPQFAPNGMNQQQSAMMKPTTTTTTTTDANSPIDYVELANFNEWVTVNLNYAVENTLASIEALKDEALQNNGTVDYSEQAIKDGIEGVKYWQSTVIFQDKTLKNEKFEQLE